MRKLCSLKNVHLGDDFLSILDENEMLKRFVMCLVYGMEGKTKESDDDMLVEIVRNAILSAWGICGDEDFLRLKENIINNIDEF